MVAPGASGATRRSGAWSTSVAPTGSGAAWAGSARCITSRSARPDEARQLEVRRAVEEAGLQITPVVDRQYFKSVYFREPGGVLFEVATDTPGFLWDEAEPELGTTLKLPPWLEPHREEIVRALPSLEGRRWGW